MIFHKLFNTIIYVAFLYVLIIINLKSHSIFVVCPVTAEQAVRNVRVIKYTFGMNRMDPCSRKAKYIFYRE